MSDPQHPPSVRQATDMDAIKQAAVTRAHAFADLHRSLSMPLDSGALPATAVLFAGYLTDERLTTPFDQRLAALDAALGHAKSLIAAAVYQRSTRIRGASIDLVNRRVREADGRVQEWTSPVTVLGRASAICQDMAALDALSGPLSGASIAAALTKYKTLKTLCAFETGDWTAPAALEHIKALLANTAWSAPAEDDPDLTGPFVG